MAYRPISPKSSYAGSVNGDQYGVSIHGSEPAIYRPSSMIMVPTALTEVHREHTAYTLPRSPKPRAPLKVILSGRGLKEAMINKVANFYVDGTKAGDGVPDAELTKASSGLRVPVRIESIKTRMYKCEYTARETGAYLLKLKWNQHPLKGSPFRVNIRASTVQKQIALHGEGWKGGIIGRDLDLRFDPRGAGPGELTVKCTGPHGEPVPCRMIDHHDGTRQVKVTPSTVGRHIVEIKHNSDHIMGSPYAINITASHVTGEVKAWGPGIQNGFIGTFQSHFFVDTTKAGAGELRIRVVGPKRAFHVRLQKASQRDKVYKASFDPREPGIYTVEIMWSNRHIMGSPYTILLADDKYGMEQLQEELMQRSTLGSVRDVLY